MEQNDYWQVFRETGDPLCWLMYRAAKRETSGETEQNAQSEG